MSSDTSIPQTALNAFPVLSRATFTKRFALPDTTFDIFVTSSQDLLALVTADYVDPWDQSRELKSISGEYEFASLLKSRSGDNETTEILEHDDMEGDFLISERYKNHRRYYYVANIRKPLTSPLADLG